MIQHEWSRDGAAARPSAALLLLAVAVLLAPSIAWVVRDRSIWSWDPAFYGTGTLDVWQALQSGPARWWVALTTVFSVKAPGIAWVGQFFVPLGLWLRSIETGLLVSILLVQAASLLLIGRTASVLAQGSSVRAVPMAFVAAGPLFAGMSHQYMTEVHQTFAAAYAYWIAASAARRSPVRTLLHLVLVVVIGSLAKINGVLFFILPLTIAGVRALRLQRRRDWSWSRTDSALLLAVLVIGVPAGVWFHRNLDSTLAFARGSASSEVAALLYGTRAPFFVKLEHWLATIGWSFLSLPDLIWIAIAGIATYVASRGVFVGVRDSRGHAPQGWLAAGALVQVALVITVFSLAINEEPRYVLPLAPSLAVLLSAAVQSAGPRVAAAVVAASLLQWGCVHARTLGAFGLRPGLPPGLAYWTQQPPVRDPRAAGLRRTVAFTCSARSIRGHVVAGVDLDWLNAHTLTFYAAKAQLSGGPRCTYVSLEIAESDPHAAESRLRSYAPSYVVTLEDSAMPPESDVLNRTARDVLKAVENDPQFAREALWPPAQIVLFRRQ